MGNPDNCKGKCSGQTNTQTNSYFINIEECRRRFSNNFMHILSPWIQNGVLENIMFLSFVSGGAKLGIGLTDQNVHKIIWKFPEQFKI